MTVYDKTPIEFGLNLFGAIPNACRKCTDGAVGFIVYRKWERPRVPYWDPCVQISNGATLTHRVILQVLKAEHLCSAEKVTKCPVQKLKSNSITACKFYCKSVYELEHIKKSHSLYWSFTNFTANFQTIWAELTDCKLSFALLLPVFMAKNEYTKSSKPLLSIHFSQHSLITLYRAVPSQCYTMMQVLYFTMLKRVELHTVFTSKLLHQEVFPCDCLSLYSLPYFLRLLS